MVRQVIPLHVFHEPRPGHVAHTAASRMLMGGEGRGYNAYVVEDCLQLAAKHVECIEKWRHGAQEPTETALNLAYNTRCHSFHSSIVNKLGYSGFQKSCRRQPNRTFSTRDIFLRCLIGCHLGNGTVIDIGGNVGHASVTIAQANPNLKFVVQDLPETIAHAEDPATTIVTKELQDRISFQARDFYKEQPVKADAYFVRLVLHDYSDKYCVKILKAIVPAMKPTSKILICEQVMPPVGVVPPPVERQLRTMDAAMGLLLNAKEREIGEWEEIIKMVDSRLRIANVRAPPHGGISILEIVLD